jgi:hypothetical protein
VVVRNPDNSFVGREGKKMTVEKPRQPAWSGLRKITKDGAVKQSPGKVRDVEGESEDRQKKIDKGSD